MIHPATFAGIPTFTFRHGSRLRLRHFRNILVNPDSVHPYWHSAAGLKVQNECNIALLSEAEGPKLEHPRRVV